jgi:hypothetical protein
MCMYPWFFFLFFTPRVQSLTWDLRYLGGPLSEIMSTLFLPWPTPILTSSAWWTRQLEKKNEYRFFSIRGRDGNGPHYHDLDVCCVLIPRERWKRVEPRTGRSIQIQANYYFLISRPFNRIRCHLRPPFHICCRRFSLDWLLLRWLGGLRHGQNSPFAMHTGPNPFL